MGKIAAVIALSVVFGGCSKDQLVAMKTELPRKPMSTDYECEDLSDGERGACKQQGPEAKNVCRKARKSAIICRDQQRFVKRLYRERDGQ